VEENGDTPKNKGKGKDKDNDSNASDNGEDEYKWWVDQDALDKSEKWKTLEHNGVYFPPEYEPHGVKMKYKGACEATSSSLLSLTFDWQRRRGRTRTGTRRSCWILCANARNRLGRQSHFQEELFQGLPRCAAKAKGACPIKSRHLLKDLI
jgi:hypothetical protein